MRARKGGHDYLEPVEDQAWLALLQLNRDVLRALDRELRVRHGLSVTEFDVLITLYNAPERQLGMSALAAATMLSPSGLTHLVTRLERDGLVSRSVDAADRRKFFTQLSPAGDDALAEARLTHNEVLRTRLLNQLTASEQESLSGIWRRLHDASAEPESERRGPR